jgi:hypothetical protein
MLSLSCLLPASSVRVHCNEGVDRHVCGRAYLKDRLRICLRDAPLVTPDVGEAACRFLGPVARHFRDGRPCPRSSTQTAVAKGGVAANKCLNKARIIISCTLRFKERGHFVDVLGGSP